MDDPVTNPVTELPAGDPRRDHLVTLGVAAGYHTPRVTLVRLSDGACLAMLTCGAGWADGRGATDDDAFSALAVVLRECAIARAAMLRQWAAGTRDAAARMIEAAHAGAARMEAEAEAIDAALSGTMGAS